MPSKTCLRHTAQSSSLILSPLNPFRDPSPPVASRIDAIIRPHPSSPPPKKIIMYVNTFFVYLALVSVLALIPASAVPSDNRKHFPRSSTTNPSSHFPSLRLGAPTSRQDSQGLTLDTCEDSGECNGSRSCTSVTDNDGACGNDDTCWCIPSEGPIRCSQHYHCVPGEACAEIPDQGTICASESYIDETSGATLIRGNVIHLPPPSEDDGLSFDSCERDNECESGRSCKQARSTDPCTDTAACVCLPSKMVFCSSSSECDSGEVCADLQKSEKECASERFVDFLSDGGVCIGMHHLQHLDQSSLVYNRHRLARVLCDVNNSCATPGHMVRFNGSPMMMQTYCTRAVCTRQVMKVNSPRYRRGVRVQSHTEGLVFTAFAARYESKLEEHFLRMLIRIDGGEGGGDAIALHSKA